MKQANVTIGTHGEQYGYWMPTPVFYMFGGGIALWIYAVPISKIDDGIKENRLVTTGAYALVRNPIYSAAMIACTGVILIIRNFLFARYEIDAGDGWQRKENV